MKKVNILTVILAIALIAVSCESYDDYNTDRKTVVGFVTLTKNISVPEGGSKSDSVKVYVSDLSNSARTFSVTTLALDSLETAAENYTYDSTVTFPANTSEAYVHVTAIDNSITDERNYFQLVIEGDANTVSGGRSLIGVRN